MQRIGQGVLHQVKREEQGVSALDVFNWLSPELQRNVTIACEKGVSSWLTALPLQDHGFSLSKGTFRDTIRIRYGWSLHNLPSDCVCGKPFMTDHTLNCKIGGYPCMRIRHNQVRDLLAPLMKGVCTDVHTEPELQSLTGEVFNRATTITTAWTLIMRRRDFGSAGKNAPCLMLGFQPLCRLLPTCTSRNALLPSGTAEKECLWRACSASWKSILCSAGLHDLWKRKPRCNRRSQKAGR